VHAISFLACGGVSLNSKSSREIYQNSPEHATHRNNDVRGTPWLSQLDVSQHRGPERHGEHDTVGDT